MAGRILVVDDDLAMCQVLEAGLGRREFEVAAFTAPEEALAAVERGDFDAVLTDLNMKGLSGIALCERIVANRPEVPVIVIVLVRMRIVTLEKLRSIRPYVIVGAFVAGAIFTPPDVVSQLLLAVPMWLLYELGMLMARFVVPPVEPDATAQS